MANAGFAYRLRVGPEAAGKTALAFLAERYRHSSASRWAERLDAGEVELDGRRCAGESILAVGDWLVWHRPPWVEAEVPTDYQVIHEDSELLAVAKPSGLPTLPGGGFLSHTLQALIRARDPSWAALHRLGRATSGLVLFARSGAVRAALQGDRGQGAIDKRYLAIAGGARPLAPQRLETPIGAVAHPRLGTVHAARAGGKLATTELLRVLGVAAAVSPQRQGWLVELRLITGRPHQIRIHLAAAGHPLVGDPLYGLGGTPLPDSPGLPGDSGYALHAWRLHLRHPGSGAALALEAPPPPTFVDAALAGPRSPEPRSPDPGSDYD